MYNSCFEQNSRKESIFAAIQTTLIISNKIQYYFQKVRDKWKLVSCNGTVHILRQLFGAGDRKKVHKYCPKNEVGKRF